jgi:ABC-type transport system involved in multi-copper enzyme maturation permease subunit
MVACVFNQEMMLAGRRQRTHWLRWLYGAMVLVQLVPVFFFAGSFQEWLLEVGFSDFFERFIALHFLLLALLTPGLVSGAITDEKTSGTLQYLLTAFLSPWEIILGKLLARIFQLVLMSLAGLPLLALLSGFGGVPELPAALAVLSLALLLGLAAASMLASVWCRQTRDALLSIYLVGVGLIAARAILDWRPFTTVGDWLHPLRALALERGTVNWQRVGECFLAWSALGLVCLALATLCLRGAYLRQLRGLQPSDRWLSARRPRIRANPVLWRERHVVGVAPWLWLRRLPRWLCCMLVALATLYSLAWVMQQALPAGVSLNGLVWQGRWLELRSALRAAPTTEELMQRHHAWALLVAWVVVAVRASGSVTEEREQATWHVLLQTPLALRSILRGKQWGIVWACMPALVSYAVVALACSLFVGASATAGCMLWLLATGLAVHFTVTVGIWCSARAHRSWRSLLATLGVCLLCWLGMAMAVGIVLGCLVSGILVMILEFANWLFGTTLQGVQGLDWSSFGFTATFFAAFWFLTHRLLVAAEKEIAKRDRNKDVDPHYEWFHKLWLRKIELQAHVPKPIDAAILNETLALASDADEFPSPTPAPAEPSCEDADALIPVPDALNPLRDYNQDG